MSWRWPWVRRGELERALEEIAALRGAIERMTDNALFAAGAAPIFDPGAQRFRTRDAAGQLPANGSSASGGPLTPAEWRHRVEEQELALARRDRRARLADELKRIADERKPAPSGGQTAESGR